MDTTFEYADSANHVERRTHLSAALRERLIDLPRDAWADDPRFHGEPAFWLQVHESLLGAAAELPVRCERLLRAVAVAMPERLDDAQPARRDALLGPTERLLAAAGRFDAFFRRHIGDEEEICIPIMLRG